MIRSFHVLGPGRVTTPEDFKQSGKMRHRVSYYTALLARYPTLAQSLDEVNTRRFLKQNRGFFCMQAE